MADLPAPLSINPMRLAKALRKGLRARDPDAIARVRAIWMDTADRADEEVCTSTSLRRCLHVVAREAGATNYLDFHAPRSGWSLGRVTDGLLQGTSVLLTGCSGSGKTFLVQRLILSLMRISKPPPVIVVNPLEGSVFTNAGYPPDSVLASGNLHVLASGNRHQYSYPRNLSLAADHHHLRHHVGDTVNPDAEFQVLTCPSLHQSLNMVVTSARQHAIPDNSVIVLDEDALASEADARLALIRLHECEDLGLTILHCSQTVRGLGPLDRWGDHLILAGHWSAPAHWDSTPGLHYDPRLADLPRGAFLVCEHPTPAASTTTTLVDGWRLTVDGATTPCTFTPLAVPDLDPLDYWILTSRGVDRQALSLLMAEGLDPWAAITTAAQRWPTGWKHP